MSELLQYQQILCFYTQLVKGFKIMVVEETESMTQGKWNPFVSNPSMYLETPLRP
jgi:hypothetical protein